MNKLITYLKQGKNYGLKAMFVFSFLSTLLSWGMYYSEVGQIAQAFQLPAAKIPLIHALFVGGLFVFTWILYGVIVGLSILLAKAFRLKLAKGLVCRSTLVSLAGLFTLSILFTLIAYCLAWLGSTAMLFYPIIIMILLPVLIVMFIAFSLAETKKK